jgi:hypothetical protein
MRHIAKINRQACAGLSQKRAAQPRRVRPSRAVIIENPGASRRRFV